MEILKLILELLDVLIWPGLVLFFLVYYKDFIEKIIERVKLKSANLPGGITLNFDKEIREGKELRSEVIEEKKIKSA